MSKVVARIPGKSGVLPLMARVRADGAAFLVAGGVPVLSRKASA